MDVVTVLDPPLNGDMPLTVETVWYFKFSLRPSDAYVLSGKKKNLIIRFLYKKSVFIEFPEFPFYFDFPEITCEKPKYSSNNCGVKNNFLKISSL